MARRRRTSGKSGKLGDVRTVLEALAILGLAVTVLLPLVYWNDLPARAPVHFGASGKPDAWGGKNTLLFLPGLAVVMYLIIVVCSHYGKVNLPFKVRAERLPVQRELALGLVRWIKAEVMLIFALCEYASIQTARGRAEGLGAWFLPTLLAVVMGTIAVYFWMAWRAR